jgi:hypothetical protein
MASVGQHQRQQQQQQPAPQLREGLPAPALRRVLQLASTSSNPALCRLCCVSKGLRAAAEAAAPPVQVTVRWPSYKPESWHYSSSEEQQAAQDRQFDYVWALLRWLERQGRCVKGLSVMHSDAGCEHVDSVLQALRQASSIRQGQCGFSRRGPAGLAAGSLLGMCKTLIWDLASA